MNHQAEIIAYMDDYVLLICATLPAILLLAMRKPKPGAVVEAEGDGITSRGACDVVFGGGLGQRCPGGLATMVRQPGAGSGEMRFGSATRSVC